MVIRLHLRRSRRSLMKIPESMLTRDTAAKVMGCPAGKEFSLQDHAEEKEDPGDASGNKSPKLRDLVAKISG